MCGASYLYVEEMTSALVQTKSDPYASRVGLERPWSREQQLQAWELYTARPRADWSILVHYPRYSACLLRARYEEFLRSEGFQFSGIPDGEVGLGTATMPYCSEALCGKEYCERLEHEFYQDIKAICQRDGCGRNWLRQQEETFKWCCEEEAETGSSLLPTTQRRGLKLDKCGRQVASERIRRQQEHSKSSQTRTCSSSSKEVHRANK